MSGKIIAFRSHQNLNRANLYRRQSVPRGLTREVRLKLQIARISALLEELEELTGTSITALAPRRRLSCRRARPLSGRPGTLKQATKGNPSLMSIARFWSACIAISIRSLEASARLGRGEFAAGSLKLILQSLGTCATNGSWDICACEGSSLSYDVDAMAHSRSSGASDM